MLDQIILISLSWLERLVRFIIVSLKEMPSLASYIRALKNCFFLQSEEPGERLCSTPISPGLLYPGDSMITLNKFNEDDDDGFFLGGFNEDGSFIGDYMDQDPETNRAVMNRLVGFQQLFSKKC